MIEPIPFTEAEQAEYVKLGAKWAAGVPLSDTERARFKELAAGGVIGDLMVDLLDADQQCP